MLPVQWDVKQCMQGHACHVWQRLWTLEPKQGHACRVWQRLWTLEPRRSEHFPEDIMEVGSHVLQPPFIWHYPQLTVTTVLLNLPGTPVPSRITLSLFSRQQLFQVFALKVGESSNLDSTQIQEKGADHPAYLGLPKLLYLLCLHSPFALPHRWTIGPIPLTPAWWQSDLTNQLFVFTYETAMTQYLQSFGVCVI